jgi:hypothetical protein
MRMRPAAGILAAVVIGQLAVGSTALAVPSPTTPPPPAEQAPAEQAPAPADPYASPPPPFGTPPPYVAPYARSGPNPMTFLTYDAQRKSAGLAVLIEFFVPGLGSLYGDHAVGTLITWVLILAGIGMLVWGVTEFAGELDETDGTRDRHTGAGTFGMSVGLVLMVGGRVYGLIDSYMATENFNRRLRLKLGLPVEMSFGPVGGGPSGQVGFGPRLHFTF